MAKYKARLVLSPAEIDKERALKLKIGDLVTIKGRTYEVIDSFRWGEDQVYILDGLGIVFYGELIRRFEEEWK